MKRHLISLMAVLFCGVAIAQEEIPAFPGAEGHGRYVTGGRSSNGSTKIYHVTNLNDSGTGSLRWALSQSGPRTIVFDVGGVIPLRSNLNIPANTTIAGQTAPYPGITLRYYTVQFNGGNVIIRFIRSRRGQEKDIDDGADAIWTRQKTGIILDHCSFSWCIDEVASFYDNNNFTMQWCTIAESLVNGGHTKGAHGYGGIWGGKLASFHHNLIAHVANRSPRFNGARYQWSGYTSNKLYSQYNWKNYIQAENVDFRNCVVYNSGNGCYGGPGGGNINIVNNYYKQGPAATTNRITTVSVGASGNSTPTALQGMTSRYYITGNVMTAKSSVTNDNWSGVTYDSGTQTQNGEHYSLDPNHYYGDDVSYTTFSGKDYVKIKLDQEVPKGEVTTHPANTAYTKVIDYAGASLFRDEVDERYMTETQSGTATYKGSVTKTAGRIDIVADVDGYTEDNFPKGSRPAGFDSDNDGMPDVWEIANGLNPNDASDASLYTLDSQKKWYTNVEVYLSSLVEDIMKNGNADAESTVNDYYPTCTTVELPSKLEDDDNNDPVNPGEGVTSQITWAFDKGASETAVFANNDAAYFSSDAVTIGANLAYNGVLNLDNGTVKENRIQALVPNEPSPSEDNALKFTFKTKEGYKFLVTNIAFTASRVGTDGGKFDVRWYDDGGETLLKSEEVPNRNNATPPYTNYSFNVTTGKATDGVCELVFNVYALGQLKDDGTKNLKEFAFGNIQITGTLTGDNTTAVETFTTDLPRTRTYYNIQGQRQTAPRKGLCIEVTQQPDGTVKSRKIISH